MSGSTLVNYEKIRQSRRKTERDLRNSFAFLYSGIGLFIIWAPLEIYRLLFSASASQIAGLGVVAMELPISAGIFTAIGVLFVAINRALLRGPRLAEKP
ncbi:MAG: hypothetical protein WB778_00565 [Thermoplasmata archaeon]